MGGSTAFSPTGGESANPHDFKPAPRAPEVSKAGPALIALQKEIQEINRNVRNHRQNPEQLKIYLRRLQLKWHPDKTNEDSVIADDVFRVVQQNWEAYCR
jgi:hypothetical protein